MSECEVCSRPVDLPSKVDDVSMCSRCHTLFIQVHVGLLESAHKTPADWLRFQRDTLPRDPVMWDTLTRYYGAAVALVGGDNNDMKVIRARYDAAIRLAETIHLVPPDAP